ELIGEFNSKQKFPNTSEAANTNDFKSWKLYKRNMRRSKTYGTISMLDITGIICIFGGLGMYEGVVALTKFCPGNKINSNLWVLQDCEKQLATLRLYRSNSIRNRSSSTSSSTATTATADVPGPVSSSENNIASTRKLTRKYTARRLKQSNPGKLSASSSREKKLSAPLSKKNSCSRFIDDENVLIDLDMKAIGWTSECKINTKKRRGSARLPPLASDFREEFKKISESHHRFRRTTFPLPMNLFPQIIRAFQDSTSRKTTIMSSWSDVTQAEDFSLSRSNSPPTTVQKFINFESENENSTTQNENGKDTKEEDGKKAPEDRKEEKDKINDNEEEKIEEMKVKKKD
ncbi:hypothetical protein Avbf_08483, partial [Armadillidium vulgare]